MTHEKLKVSQVEYSKSLVKIKIVPQRELNAYYYNWQPGDFLIHMPGMSFDTRIMYFKKYLSLTINTQSIVKQFELRTQHLII